MPQVFTVQPADDPRDAVHDAIERLVQGELVAFPTETVYIVTASAASEPGLDKLRGLCDFGLGQPTLQLKGEAELLDYFPQMTTVARRLARRTWPGPVTLSLPVSTARGAFTSLSNTARNLLGQSGAVATRAVQHPWLASALRLLPIPLVGVGETLAERTSRTASEMATILSEAGAKSAVVLDQGPCRYDGTATVVRIGESGSWSVDREGVATERVLRRLTSEVILFVCTGNTCRSPMAEGLFRKLLTERLNCHEEDLVDRGFIVLSAGVSAMAGSPASPESVAVLRQQGIDIHGHESQPVTDRLIQQADRIYTMTRGHRDWLLREFPQARPITQLVSRDDRDVSDPIGGGIEDYVRCAEQIETALRQILTDVAPEV